MVSNQQAKNPMIMMVPTPLIGQVLSTLVFFPEVTASVCPLIQQLYGLPFLIPNFTSDVNEQ
ncbi:hypothetical protein Hamer_G003399 [Homarus americanus]|uniref:Uncharacterized protein n=1 Tax=Homarus americanus TaxID=6706 RepID=A0A8J5N6G3_HOMAM|nr:hypothetical protein Hamer_G003399 [Homarus americanus]